MSILKDWFHATLVTAFEFNSVTTLKKYQYLSVNICGVKAYRINIFDLSKAIEKI